MPRTRPPRATRALFLAVCLPLALVACNEDEPAADDANSAQTVSTAPVVRREMASGLSVSGPVSAVEEMQLGVEVSGLRVTALNVDVGQRVRRGQVLLTLDHRMLDADLAQANASLREAEAGANLARANLARGENLARGQYISTSQLDELRAARTQGEARLGTARAARDTAALRRGFADLRAPAAGVIAKRSVQPGQVVAAGSPLIYLIRDGRLEWRAELPATQLARVKPGDVIRLTGGEGGTVEGRVRAVSPGVDAANRTGTVFADLPPDLLEAGTMQVGAYLEGRIDTGSGSVLAVPADALVLRDGFPTVFVLDRAKAVVQAHRVETGTREGGFVEVRGGVEAGAQVVVEGAGFLAEGDRVRVAPASTAAPAKRGAAP
ncbi:efflux RND transporter periplasmic adaptor subunit [Lysobacter pythonis]|uniref:Efflux RND transporter periplasmic adaptor subunit n=1 Tax=Solilutibacter pythonis TaxID=2483112 RepID=A0A3M2I2K5_9GAMM|nr:efflux RND transporter periplasmic adaptor subunit [Lysobacter pythonis]RMH93829.1 efflux RND transporter periplasmic adaptor subunit [Lysobacter pythonis]